MMRLFIACLLFLFSVTFATRAQDKKKTNEVIGTYQTIDGQTFEMFGSFSLSAKQFTYELSNGKSKSIPQNEVKWLFAYNRAYLGLPTKKNGQAMQLMEVLAISSDYILVKYWATSDYSFFFIFDHFGKPIGQKLTVGQHGVTVGVEKNNRAVVEILKSHFNCPQLFQAMNANIAAQNFLSDGIVVYKCDGAPDLESIMEGLGKKSFYKN